MQYIRVLPVSEEEREQGLLAASMEGEILPVLIEFDRGYLVGREEQTLLILHKHAEVVDDVDPV